METEPRDKDFGGTDGKFRIDRYGQISLIDKARTKNATWIDAGGIKAPGAKPATLISHGVLELPVWQFANQALEANQESVSFSMRLPERMDRSESPSLYIGWSADGVNPGNCKWQLEYLWTSLNESTIASPQDAIAVITAASTISNGLVLTEIAGLELPSVSDLCLHCRITRLSASADDTIADTVELIGACLYFTANKHGTPI